MRMWVIKKEGKYLSEFNDKYASKYYEFTETQIDVKLFEEKWIAEREIEGLDRTDFYPWTDDKVEIENFLTIDKPKFYVKEVEIICFREV